MFHDWMFQGYIKPKFVCVIYFYMEFYMPCKDYSFVITLKALYEILIVSGLSYKYCIFFSIIMLFILLNMNYIKNVSSESFRRFPW
jgi:hypothetical protein